MKSRRCARSSGQITKCTDGTCGAGGRACEAGTSRKSPFSKGTRELVSSGADAGLAPDANAIPNPLSACVIYSRREKEDLSMSGPPYRSLSLGLRVMSALIAVGGAFMILSGKPLVLRVFMHPPESEVSTLLLALLKEMGWRDAHAQPDAVSCRPRPGTQRRHPGRAHCGSLHPRHHAAAVSQDARSWQPLSNVFDLGPVAGQAGVGVGSVLRASPGFASQSPIMRECRCVQIS